MLAASAFFFHIEIWAENENYFEENLTTKKWKITSITFNVAFVAAEQIDNVSKTRKETSTTIFTNLAKRCRSIL